VILDAKRFEPNDLRINKSGPSNGSAAFRPFRDFCGKENVSMPVEELIFDH